MCKLTDKKSIKTMTFLLTVTYMVSYVTRLNFGAILPEMVEQTGMTKGMLSAAVTGSAVTYGLGQLLSGYLGDRVSPKRLVLAGLLVMEAIPGPLIGLFNATPELLEIGVPALRTICLSFCFAGYCIVVGSVFQALGNGVYSMIVSIARQLCVLLPVAYLLSLSGNVNLIWWAFPIAELVSMGMSTYFLIRINNNVISRIGEVSGA